MPPPPATPGLEDGLERLLGKEDVRAYRRFIDWSLGHGFKLAIVRMPMPAEAGALAAWTHEHVPHSCQVPLDQAEGRSVWALLEEVTSRVPEASLLVLTRLEECRDKQRICRELNVLRDELARQWAVPWVLVAHPGAVLELEREAPDFCDFAGLWLGRGVELVALPVGDIASPAAYMSNAPRTINHEPAGHLGQMAEAVARGRYDEAADLLAQYDLSATDEQRRLPERLMIEAHLCFQRGDLARAAERLRETLAACDANDNLVRGYALITQGQIAWLQGRADETLNRSEAAREIALRLEDRVAGVRILQAAAQLQAVAGHIDTAVALIAEGFALLEGFEAQASRAHLLKGMASLRAKQGHMDEALGLYHEALVIFEELDDFREQALIRCDLALLKARQGHTDEALALLQQQLTNSTAVETQVDRAMVLGHLADILQQLGRFDEALLLLEEQLAIYEKQGSILDIVTAHVQLGLLAFLKGEFEIAEEHYCSSYSLSIQYELSGQGTAISGMLLALSLSQRGDIPRARELLERARDTFRQMGQEAGARNAETYLSRLAGSNPSPPTL